MARAPRKSVPSAAILGVDAAVEVKRRKQAVVIVHGMGEQKPLETLRGFAEAVWDAKLIPGEKKSDDDIWLVPDTRAGLTELARVTTRSKDGIATDFYELYWSDLLVGNTLAQIRAWVSGLLLRWPHQVPRETFGTWIALWCLVLGILAIAGYVGLTGWPKALWSAITTTTVSYGWKSALASVGLGAGLGYAMLRLLRRSLGLWSNADKTFPGIWASLSPKELSVTAAISWTAVVLLPIIAAGVLFCFFPWSILWQLKTWLLIAAALCSAVLTVFVVPVFGDVARYVRVSPDAVQARAAIRERGVALLRALHDPVPLEGREHDRGDPAPYERIVVVGHSLGSIIAYDVLRLFWEERGPTGRNPPAPKSQALVALKRLQDFLKQIARPKKEDSPGGATDVEAEPATDDMPTGKAEDLGEADGMRTFRMLQWEASAALRAEKRGWLISDFVSLGSPLTHAEFLISRDRAAFEERKAERMFPTCPPMLEPPRREFLYWDGQRRIIAAHHAAMFSAMRWTNIYDPSKALLFGDFISGPCAPNFGPGVLDLPIRIAKGGLFSRLVTHTHYWDVDASGLVADAVGKKLGVEDISHDPKGHLTLLRAALALKRNDPA